MAKAKRRVRDTWREKVWYDIKAPIEFGEKEIGETPSRDPEFLIGRNVDVTMRELTGDFSKQYIKLNFEINNVAGKVANTRFAGHKITSDRIRSMIRRGTSRIDSIAIVKTKDGHEIKVHVLDVTNKRAKYSQQKFMRETIKNLVTESASEKSFKEFTEILTNGRLASEIYHNAKKIYPLNRVEIIKSKVYN